MTARPEWAGGWLRLGCATGALVVAPLWFGATAMLVHVWGAEWYLLFGWPGPVTLFGIPVVWFIAAFRTALWILALVAGGAVLLAVGWGIRMLTGLVAHARMQKRYQAVVGDGDVVQPGAWDGVADELDPDPTDPGEDP